MITQGEVCFTKGLLISNCHSCKLPKKTIMAQNKSAQRFMYDFDVQIFRLDQGLAQVLAWFFGLKSFQRERFSFTYRLC